MNIYIKASANISPQETFTGTLLTARPVAYETNMLKAIEPDYKELIDAKALRRMSRVIKMGVAAALGCLRTANELAPDAIITGTAYGCLADTELFLSSMVAQHEEMLSPTSFIQSTHNTVGAQIALITQCNGYNNTFVNGGFSFENALQDAIMLLREGEAANVLTGGIDELTPLSYDILSRFGLYKRTPVSSLDLLASGTKGTVAGEGAAFFLLSGNPSPGDLAQIAGLATFYKPGGTKGIADKIAAFLAENGLNTTDIDLVITGKNGDAANDAHYDDLNALLFTGNEVINYKHLCGDYPTAVSFALWLAAELIKNGQETPGLFFGIPVNKRPLRILICNNYRQLHHSAILVTACD